jgi:dTMP kinase
VFITFEGIDRSGKTTQARMLAEALGDEAVLVREPGGTQAAERIRELVKGDTDLSPMTETLLFGAARADLVERVIRPALAAGKTVIGDRYVDSTVAYQGGARGLGIERVEELNRWITGDLWPDITLLLDVAPAVAGERSGDVDRFEREGQQLQRAVAAAYDELAERHLARYVRIDATRTAEEVHRDVLERVRAGAIR